MSAAHRPLPRILIRSLLVLTLGLAAVLPPGVVSRVQGTEQGDSGNAVASDTVTVEADLPDGDYAWVAELFDVDEGSVDLPADRFGFIVSIDTIVDVSDAAGVVADLARGEARGLETGRDLSVTARDDGPARIAVVGLVPADDAAGPDTIAFPLTDGRYRMVVQRYEPPAGEAVRITGLIQPIMVLVQAGDAGFVTVDGSGSPTDDPLGVGPGGAMTLLEDSQLTPTGDDALVLQIIEVGRIGDAAGSSAQPSPEPSDEPSLVASPSGSAPPRFGVQRVPSVSPSPSRRGGLVEPSRRPDRSRPSDRDDTSASPSPSLPPPFGS